jgi:hypothetical protein
MEALRTSASSTGASPVRQVSPEWSAAPWGSSSNQSRGDCVFGETGVSRGQAAGWIDRPFPGTAEA